MQEVSNLRQCVKKNLIFPNRLEPLSILKCKGISASGANDNCIKSYILTQSVWKLYGQTSFSCFRLLLWAFIAHRLMVPLRTFIPIPLEVKLLRSSVIVKAWITATGAILCLAGRLDINDLRIWCLGLALRTESVCIHSRRKLYVVVHMFV